MKKRLLPFLAVLLVVGAGAGMPWAAALVQDLYDVSSQEVLPFDPVSLTLQQYSELGTVLRLMSTPSGGTAWPGETRMSEEEAGMAALDTLVQLDQYGLLESGDLGPYGRIEPDIIARMKESGECSAAPLLFIAPDGTTAIIWVCRWTGAGGPGYELWIDDITGKAVTGYIPSPYITDPAFDSYRIVQWLAFFQDCYGAEIPEVEEQSYDGIPRFIYHIDPGDGLGELGIILQIYNYEMSFSPCSADLLNVLPDERETPYITLPQPVKPGMNDSNRQNK